MAARAPAARADLDRADLDLEVPAADPRAVPDKLAPVRTDRGRALATPAAREVGRKVTTRQAMVRADPVKMRAGQVVDPAEVPAISVREAPAADRVAWVAARGRWEVASTSIP